MISENKQQGSRRNAAGTSGIALAGVATLALVACAGLAGCQSTAATATANTSAAATGDAAGYVSRHKDLELARKVGRQIEKTYAHDVARVDVKARPVAVPEADRAQMGGAKSVETLDALVVSIPHALVAGRDKAIASAFGHIGNYLSNASGASKVAISAHTQKDFDYIVSNIRSGYAYEIGAGKVGYEFRRVARGTPVAVEVMPI